MLLCPDKDGLAVPKSASRALYGLVCMPWPVSLDMDPGNTGHRNECKVDARMSSAPTLCSFGQIGADPADLVATAAPARA